VVGAANIIQGFSQGVTGMRVGGVRRVVLPSSLAYKAQAPERSRPTPRWCSRSHY
jgi:FKBP-type peptidyl-prolyl cis-trans isomerase